LSGYVDGLMRPSPSRAPMNKQVESKVSDYISTNCLIPTELDDNINQLLLTYMNKNIVNITKLFP